MTTNKLSGGFIDLNDDADPSVASSIGGADRRRNEARLSPKDRKKKTAQRQKARDRLKNRVNWDLPLEIKQRVKVLAAEHVVPESQVAALFIAEGLRRMDAREIDLDDYKIPSDSPRYDFNLVLDQAGLREIRKSRSKGRPLA